MLRKLMIVEMILVVVGLLISIWSQCYRRLARNGVVNKSGEQLMLH